jgi:glyceraldehyde-3-phosphate dehydrogenase (NADP+)
MIDEASAAKAELWVNQALDKGAKLLLGGKRKGTMFPPTILANVPRTEPAYCAEIFAPVVVISKYKDFESALAEVNDSIYGLQAGIFTNDLKKALRAFEILEVGGVMIGDIPTFRIDNMPYGGVKNSGFGREGVKYAMEEMSELKLLTFNPLA